MKKRRPYPNVLVYYTDQILRILFVEMRGISGVAHMERYKINHQDLQILRKLKIIAVVLSLIATVYFFSIYIGCVTSSDDPPPPLNLGMLALGCQIAMIAFFEGGRRAFLATDNKQEYVGTAVDLV